MLHTLTAAPPCEEFDEIAKYSGMLGDHLCEVVCQLRTNGEGYANPVFQSHT